MMPNVSDLMAAVTAIYYGASARRRCAQLYQRLSAAAPLLELRVMSVSLMFKR